MAEPGTTVVGEARNPFRVDASQVKLEARNAWVYEKPAAAAECRPYRPMREGPCAPPLSPGSAEWQRLHCWRKRAFPAIASAPNAGGAAARTGGQTTGHTAIEGRLIRAPR